MSDFISEDSGMLIDEGADISIGKDIDPIGIDRPVLIDEAALKAIDTAKIAAVSSIAVAVKSLPIAEAPIGMKYEVRLVTAVAEKVIVDPVSGDHVVLLNSGGLDSACLAKRLHDDGMIVHSLLINNHLSSEVAQLKAAQETADRYCATHQVMPLDLGFTETLVYNDFQVTSPGATWLYALLGALHARKYDAVSIFSGLKGTFVPLDYTERINQLINDLRLPIPPVSVVTPLIALGITQYKDILAYAEADAKEMTYTVSCGFDPPCGTCFRCKDRAILFGEA